jgi:hypothetical protein
MNIKTGMTIIAPVELCGLTAMSVTVYEDRKSRTICGFKRVEEGQCLMSNQIKKGELGGACSMYWEKRSACRVLED